MLCYLNRGKKISFLLQHKSLVYFLDCIAKIVLKSRLFFQGHFKTFGFAYYVVCNHFIMKMRSILIQKIVWWTAFIPQSGYSTKSLTSNTEHRQQRRAVNAERRRRRRRAHSVNFVCVMVRCRKT